jgi:hypothetical protein
MVAPELGEHGDVDAGAVEAVLRQAMRGRLQGQAPHAGVGHFRQRALHPDGVRRRQPGRAERAHAAVAEGAQQASGRARLVQHGGQEVGHGGLAVRAGDGDHLGQGPGGGAEKARGQPAQVFGQRGHGDGGGVGGATAALEVSTPAGIVGVDDDGAGAARQGGIEVVEAVAVTAGQGDEGVTRPDRAAIEGEPSGLRLGPCGPDVRPALQQTAPVDGGGGHHVPPPWRATRRSSRPSGRMSSRRKAPAMTRPKTGAAIWPP